ncbi:stalk domain-containing protein [Paenibacillus sp. S-38]|uniref:stalk domain-containing protein n=1 Tax=Paenibacillus sp. S-38 TaxID=3416710 RepID=UPI003CEAEEC0
MKELFSKKVLSVLTVSSLSLAVGAWAYADDALKQISAYQNAGISIKVNGSSIDLSSEDGMMYPIIYEGHSYVPAKALAEAMGGTVKWNNDAKAVEVTSGGSPSSSAGIPNKDNSTPASKPAASTGKAPVAFYTPSTPASTMYEENKKAAAEVLKLYADALKTGSTTALESWMKNSFQESEWGSTSYETASSGLSRTIEAYREEYDEQVLGAFADSLVSKANSLSFSEDSKSSDDTYSKDLEYFIDVEGAGYKGKLGVYFFYKLNQDTNKFYFGQAAFY